MSFWFPSNFVLGAGQSTTVEYWFTNGADVGAQMATPVPYYAANAGLMATGQGLRYDFAARKFIYAVSVTNFGGETANFQIRGGGFT